MQHTQSYRHTSTSWQSMITKIIFNGVPLFSLSNGNLASKFIVKRILLVITLVCISLKRTSWKRIQCNKRTHPESVFNIMKKHLHLVLWTNIPKYFVEECYFVLSLLCEYQNSLNCLNIEPLIIKVARPDLLLVSCSWLKLIVFVFT